jgi:Zn-dependent peptidase ImmA (M78 family)
MGLPGNFRNSIRRVNRVIRFTEAHHDIRYPVDIDRILKKLSIEVIVEPFEDDVLEGYCTKGDALGRDRKIYINSNKPVEVRRKAKAHELYHLWEHGELLPLYSHIGQVDATLEKEANYAAAYYLVPGKTIKLALEWQMKFEDLAEKMCVPLELVMKRYDIYLELKEYNHELELWQIQ